MKDHCVLPRTSRRRVVRTAAAVGGALAAGYIAPDLRSLGTPTVLAAVSGVPKGPPLGRPKGPSAGRPKGHW